MLITLTLEKILEIKVLERRRVYALGRGREERMPLASHSPRVICPGVTGKVLSEARAGVPSSRKSRMVWGKKLWIILPWRPERSPSPLPDLSYKNF